MNIISSLRINDTSVENRNLEVNIIIIFFLLERKMSGGKIDTFFVLARLDITVYEESILELNHWSDRGVKIFRTSCNC